MDRKCETCEFYVQREFSTGDCRRYAPSQAEKATFAPYHYRAVWPQVDKDDYCGEYKPKGEA